MKIEDLKFQSLFIKRLKDDISLVDNKNKLLIIKGEALDSNFCSTALANLQYCFIDILNKEQSKELQKYFEKEKYTFTMEYEINELLENKESFDFLIDRLRQNIENAYFYFSKKSSYIENPKYIKIKGDKNETIKN